MVLNHELGNVLGAARRATHRREGAEAVPVRSETVGRPLGGTDEVPFFFRLTPCDRARYAAGMKTNIAARRSPKLPILLAGAGVVALVGFDVWLGSFCCHHRAQTTASRPPTVVVEQGAKTIGEFWMAAR